MARKDFVLDSAQNFVFWGSNYSGKVGDVATRISWPMASVTLLKAQLAIVITAAQGVIDAHQALDTALGLFGTAKKTPLAQVRTLTNNLKTTIGFNEGDAKNLGVFSTPENFDPTTYQPALEADARHGYVNLMGKKLGADSLNVYWRPAGTANWLLLAAKRVRFPFHDDTPPPAGQSMQAREYMAMGVIGDEEVGNPSAITSAVYQQA